MFLARAAYIHTFKRSRTSACMGTSLPAVLSLGCVLGGGPGCGGGRGTGPAVSGRRMQGMKLWKYIKYPILNLKHIL